MPTDITKKPTGGVSSLHVKRGSGYRIEAGWKVPKSLTNDSDHRTTELGVTWSLGIKGTDPKDARTYANESATSSAANVNSFNAGRKTYTRASFYPLTKTRLHYVTCKVRAANAKGESPLVPSATLEFELPRKPSIAAYSVDATSGIISTTITTNAGTDRYERYDTEYYWRVKNSKTGQWVKNVHTTSSSTSINLSANVSALQSLGTGYIACSCKARARGLKGASEWVERRYYLAFPNAPVIKRIDAPTGITGTVVAYISTNRTTQHPVTKVQLQALVDVEYATVEEAAAASSEWDDVGAPDDGKCSALAVNVADVRPTTAGRHSWLRVRAVDVIDNLLYSYSAPVELTTLYRPAYSATGDTVTILDGHAGADGESAVMLLGWQDSSSTGTELSWSSELDTWRSTDEPDTFNVLYDDGSVTRGGTTYAHSATITIKGLDEGQTTYVKARRYHEGADATTYGPYSEAYMVTPAQIPASVTLACDGYVAEGSDLTLTWTYEGGATQDAWCVLDGTGTIVAQGQNALGTCTIEADRLASLAVGGALELRVMVSMGGAWVTSAAKAVTIVEAPTLTATTAATLTAQPMAISATCDVSDATLTVIVTADGVSGDMPYGMDVQARGDVVWSGVVEPEWVNGAATVTLPEGLAFADKAGYTVTVRATDPSTGLSSETVTAQTTVAWSHQAPDPAGSVAVTPDPTAKSATLTLAAPTGSTETDCYDIYRLTGDGAQLIGEGWPLSATVTDDYAPYGDGMALAYRVALRTADGDVQWADVPYWMGGSAIRIDWAGQSVELPYNIAISDGYAKDADVHEYLDGSTDAFFNEGIRRTAKLSTDVMRLTDADTIAAVLDLAHHVGPAFVRTPTGAAYEADVQVESVTPTHELAAVSVSATEVRLTPAYQLPPYNVVEEE